MAGISEVIQTIGAVIIFSLILLTSNRMILSNTFREVETEAEGMAVTIGQNIIEEAQTKAFDSNTVNGDVPTNIPAGFSSVGTDSGETRSDFKDFDDYDGYSEEVDTEWGTKSFKLDVEVSYVSPSDNYDMAKGSKTVPTNFKKMRVTLTSEYLKGNTREIQLTYLRRYYKTKNE